MRCPKCKHENQVGRKFCSKCGTPLENVCSKCGFKNDPDDEFCGECGAKLTESTILSIPKLEDMQDKLYIPEPLRQRMDTAKQELQGENRLVTALFADISGFTPLSNQHSTEKVVDVVNQCFKVIIDTVFRYEGDPNRFIGDNVLAFFGAPIAHENDPERAIMAALEIRDKVRELSLNVSIGINTGMMYFGTIGTKEHHEVSAYGPDINLAKRLQEYAEPGQILVGSGTHRLTRRAFDFDIIQSLNLKGFDQPITAYSVQQMKLHPEKLRGIEGLRARMIGREHEFADVKEAIDEWLSGHGQIVSVIGEAGIGKSRLVSELKTYLSSKDDKQFQYIEGRCVSIGQPISYWPFIDILKTYFNLSEGDGTATIANKVTDSITQLMPQSADETLPLLGQLLSIKYGNELDDRLKFATPEQVKHQTLMRLRDIFTTLARKKPLLLILEDLHWPDDLSLDLISLLMDELANTPLMLLCVYRPEHDHRVWQLSNQARRKCMDRFTEIILNPLSSIESRELIESLLEIENLPEPIKKMIMEKSEGNPFFIEEVIRSLIEQGMIYQENDRWIAKDEISDINVPDTIQSVILSRVDRLQAEAKYVLQCASVIGRLFKHRLLEHLTHQERELNRYISEFEERELIYEERMVPELEYAFKHALTQEATYQSILERKRKEFHHQVAQGIERLYQERLEEYYEELADHYSKSDDVEKSIEYLLKAGEKIAKLYMNQEALNYFNQALHFAETDIERIQLLSHRAKLFVEMFRGREAVSDYEQLLKEAKKMSDRKLELEFTLGLAKAYYIINLDHLDFASKFRETCESAYKLALELDEKAGMVQSLILTIWFNEHFPEYSEQSIENVKQALIISYETGNEDLIIDSKIALAHALSRAGYDKESAGQSEELIKKLEERHDLPRLKEIYNRFMWIHLRLGNFVKSIECCNAGIRLATDLGVPPVQYPTIKALALLKLGYYDSAWQSLQEEVSDNEHLFGIAMKNAGIGEYYFELMDYDKVSEISKVVIQQANNLGRGWIRNWAFNKYAMAQMRSNQLDGTNLDEVIQNLTIMNIPFPDDVIVEMDLATGDLDKALQRSVELCSISSDKGARPYYLNVLELQLRILLKMQKPEDVIILAGNGIKMAEEMKYLPILWRIKFAKEQAFNMLGKKDDALNEHKSIITIIEGLMDNISDVRLRQNFKRNLSIMSIIDEDSLKGDN